MGLTGSPFMRRSHAYTFYLIVKLCTPIAKCESVSKSRKTAETTLNSNNDHHDHHQNYKQGHG